MIRWNEWRGSLPDVPTFFIKKLLTWRGRVVQLHRFVAADEPFCFHTHPARAVRIVLWGGYVEEVVRKREPVSGVLVKTEFVTWRPGRIGFVPPELDHRIDRLLNGRSSWSLWLRGRKTHKINFGC